MDNELGEFLRARRARRSPRQAGLAYSGRRQVDGLRREEVAVLAGVNADYYARLEQGRERHPSAQVLDALARALDLDADARAHLHRLAGVMPNDERAQPVRTVSPQLRQLLDGYSNTPAFVIDRTLNLKATNALADALFAQFRPADNLARMTFLDPARHEFFADWDWTAQATVANLREAAGFAPDDAELARLVDTLAQGNKRFHELWKSHEVRGKTRAPKHLVHADVGPLTLTYHTFDVREAPGHQLIIYQA